MQVVFVDKALHLVGFLNTAYDAALIRSSKLYPQDSLQVYYKKYPKTEMSPVSKTAVEIQLLMKI